MGGAAASPDPTDDEGDDEGDDDIWHYLQQTLCARHLL